MTPFLQDHGWAEATCIPLAGDASARQYWRLTAAQDSAILMHDDAGDIPRFVQIARHLTNHGLSAPAILAQRGPWLLLEDLGDALFAHLCRDDPASEDALYLAATDVLIDLHQHAPLSSLPKATPDYLADKVDLAFDWYQRGTTGAIDQAAKAACSAAFAEVLAQTAPGTDVMILRDYHAENLIWLPDRTGAARVGLLDFQDALAGHRAYDLVSLIQDARRDVRPQTAQKIVRHYIASTGVDADAFETALAALGAQRNLRILGIFARLAAVRKKPHYVDLIPRVWAHLQSDLAHPALHDVRQTLTGLPAPTTPLLERLKAQCPIR